MKRVFVSPANYIQGPNILMTEMDEIKALGDKVLLLCDDFVWEIVGKEYVEALKNADIIVKRLEFSGESSLEELEKLSQSSENLDSNLVIGLGGGKTLDSAKGLANHLKTPVVIIPTVASTDAPTSRISVIYTEEGLFEKYFFYPKNPDLVLVDTKVIIQAPVSLLIGGIGDALATWVEIQSVVESQSLNLVGGQPTLTAMAIGEKCEEVIFRDALAAVEANKNKEITPAFENVVEANTLLSGLGFENGGLSLAHALHNSFSVIDAEVNKKSHGEKVAFATLVQLYLEGNFEKLNLFLPLYKKLGLPTSLSDIGLMDLPYETLLGIGKQAMIKSETSQRMSFLVTKEKIAEGILKVAEYNKKFFLN